MLPTVRYCQGYGWHVGRPLVWAGLMALGIPLAFIAVAIESLASAAIHMRMPIAMLMPALFGLAGRRRLNRKLAGEPFAVCLPEFFMDDMTAWLVPRGHRHFRALVMIEASIWGSVVLAQLFIIGTFYARG